jgi:predicted ATPase/DNA-binding SARP family transcriptional activator
MTDVRRGPGDRPVPAGGPAEDERGTDLEFRILGQFEVMAGGRLVQLSPRPRKLLAALLLRPETVSTDVLIESVWDGTPPSSAAPTLRMYVSKLRRVLPAERVVTDGKGYRLVVRSGELDAARFEAGLAEGREALAGGNPRLARAALARALDLWRGDALAGLSEAGFAREEARRLDELRLACLEERIQTDLDLGRHAEVVAELESLVAAYPARERYRVQLMTALYRVGRHPEALERYRDGRAALLGELGLEPGPELRELEQRILRHDPTLASPAFDRPPPLRVARPHSPTIGRETQIADLCARLLEPPTRLVTLVGPGGIGKTRLATEVAIALAEELTDGAALVDLAPLTEASQLLASIGRALGLRESDSSSWEESLGGHLCSKELLLVLDNFEHVVESAPAIAPLLDIAPRLTVLVTSRRVLRLSAEQVVEVQPLDDPSARQLLAARASAAGAAVDIRTAPFGEVCERLDGVPLAIELAAPWLRILSAEELLRRLESQLEALGEGARDAPPRHRTMRAAIEWSFSLLEPPAQHLLGRVSLFRGQFTLEAAAAVGGLHSASRELAALVEASVVRPSGPEYGLLEVVREYGLGLPSADDEGRDLHAAHFLAFAETAEPELAGADQGAWLERLESSHDDLRAALDWYALWGDSALELRLAASLGRFWYIRGYLQEGIERLLRALETAGEADPALTANALRTASALAVLRGDYEQARGLAERALALYRNAGDARGVVRSLSNLGAILFGLEELELAAATLDECIVLAEQLDERRLVALARNNRGDVALSAGELEIAADQFEQSLALLRDANDVANVARALYNLGAVEIGRGSLDAARSLLIEALQLSVGVDDKEDVAWCLIALASIGERAGKLQDAATVLGFTNAFLKRIGATLKPSEKRLFDETLARVGEIFDRSEVQTLLAAGERMQDGDVLELARAL